MLEAKGREGDWDILRDEKHLGQQLREVRSLLCLGEA